ncbi:MAG: hypothetical protein GY832_44500 [Chloroflexi bacterium]|nr:hypothetical protein [Chloroflexota bacterium]
MDTCYYCGATYHPMPVYSLQDAQGDISDWWTNPDRERKPLHIHVCHLRISEDGEVESHDECKGRATSDGYVYSPNLTPTR